MLVRVENFLRKKVKAITLPVDTPGISNHRSEIIKMNAMAALRQYQTVNVHAQVGEASPHRLIQMLMDGGLSRMAQARGAMMRGDIAQKCELIGKAIAIVGGLRDGLDLEKGGELAANLDRLYAYMTTRLAEANASNDAAVLEEVMGLLREVKSGWDAIAH